MTVRGVGQGAKCGIRAGRICALVGIALIAVYQAGYEQGRASLAAAEVVVLATAEPTPEPPVQPIPTPDEFALLAEIRSLAESEFFYRERSDRRRLLYGAADGMVRALGDPNAAFEPPAERQVNEWQWTGHFEGIGIYLDQRDGVLLVTAPIEGGPAEMAGVRAGDAILEVDGKAISGLPLHEQALLIRGPKGTPVTLTVRRQSLPELLRLTIVRDEIRQVTARGTILENGLGLLRISQFAETTPDDTARALETALAAGLGGLVVDLRGNGGGLVEPAVRTAGLFLGGGPVVLEAHANGHIKTYTAPDGPPRTRLPLMVLVDRGTASAAELFAAALRDRGAAELIGERTYGKGTVQYLYQLSDGSGLRLTTAEWWAPSGRAIAGGLEPDQLMATQGQSEPGHDSVLEAASQRLLARMVAAAP